MGANSVVGKITGLAKFEDLDNETTVTIQPGLAVSVYGSRLQQLNASFPSDDKYIHLNYLLKGQFKAQVRGTKVHLNQGESVIRYLTLANELQNLHGNRLLSFRNGILKIYLQLLLTS